MKTRHHAQALIGILVALAIGMLLYVFLLGPSVKKDDGSTVSAQKAAIDKADDTVTDINISQLRTIIAEVKNDTGKPPESFDELKRISKMPDSYFIDPVTKRSLFYDPVTGFIGRDTEPRPAAPAASASPQSAPVPAQGAPGVPDVKIPQPAAPDMNE